jgi:hypothetical protein
MAGQPKPDQATIIQQYRARRTRQILIGIGVLVAVALLAFLARREAVFGPIVFGVAVLGLVASFFNWRCPACRRYLGRSFNPAFCPNCGTAFREQ